MDDRILTEMPLDELWALHQSVASILPSRLEAQKSELEARLRRLRCRCCAAGRAVWPSIPPVQVSQSHRAAPNMVRTRQATALDNGVARCRTKHAGFSNPRNDTIAALRSLSSKQSMTKRA